MFNLNDSMRYWLYVKPTDMRKSFYTLSGLVSNNMHMSVLNGDVFVFINKKHDRMKILHMETGGLVLYSKLLEEGRFRLPSNNSENDNLKITWLDLTMIVEGIKSDPSTRLKRLKLNRIS